jgi:hypothetical protein
MQHGPDRDKILESFKILNAQYDQTVDRARADLQSGLPLEDLIIGGSAEFAKATPEALAATLICRILKEASKPVPKPRKKTSVPAKRARVSREVLDGQPTA